MTNLASLPTEILLEIFVQLDYTTLKISLRAACRRFRDIIDLNDDGVLADIFFRVTTDTDPGIAPNSSCLELHPFIQKWLRRFFSSGAENTALLRTLASEFPVHIGHENAVRFITKSNIGEYLKNNPTADRDNLGACYANSAAALMGYDHHHPNDPPLFFNLKVREFIDKWLSHETGSYVLRSWYSLGKECNAMCFRRVLGVRPWAIGGSMWELTHCDERYRYFGMKVVGFYPLNVFIVKAVERGVEDEMEEARHDHFPLTIDPE